MSGEKRDLPGRPAPQIEKRRGAPAGPGTGDWTEEQRFILRCLYNSYQEGKLIGRRAICQEARRIQLLLTEQEVRNQLKQLEDMGLVKVGTGRAGSRLTPEGVVLLSGGI